jgi:hypothetical protein
MPFTDEATRLSMNRFQYTRRGYVRFEGPVVVGAAIAPDWVYFVWCWYGPRYQRTVRRVGFGENGIRKLVLCPRCGERRYTLYLLPPNSLGCRQCLDLWYAAWRYCSSQREPKTPAAWLRWFTRSVGRKARKHGLKEVVESAAEVRSRCDQAPAPASS